jgi:hypothetical protein
MTLIQAFAHFLAGFEKGNRLFIHRHMHSRARIAADPCVAVFHGESPETAQFNPVAARQSVRDLIENGIDDFFYIAKVKMRITIGDPLYKFGFDHRPRPAKLFVQNQLIVHQASVGAVNLPNRQ